MASSTTAPWDEYQALFGSFAQFHQNHTNVFLHFITTPLGFIGLVGAVRALTKSTSVAAAGVVGLLVYLLPSLSVGTFIATSLLSLAAVLISRKLNLCLTRSMLFIAASYVLQDLAHWLTNEPSFQASYSNGGHIDMSNLDQWFKQFAQHTLYLLPMCVDLVLAEFMRHNGLDHLTTPFPAWASVLRADFWFIAPLIFITAGNYCLDSRNGFCFFPGSAFFYRIGTCNIAGEDDDDSQRNNLSIIRQWAMDQNPPENMSSHFWYSQLPEMEKAAFKTVANCNKIVNMFREMYSEKHYCLDVVEGMNEVYISGPTRSEEEFNSDQIFYTKHVDGPYGFIPFASVYRCIVGMDRNYMLTTRFPMNTIIDHNACMGDVLAFDFNREVHYLTRDDSRRAESDDFRVTLKLHYCMYPRVLYPIGWMLYHLNVKYNISFRALFLKTINPQSLLEHFLAWNVVVNTTIFNNMEMLFGIRNIMYVALLSLMWYRTGEYRIFLYGTSFVHYIRYITTYYYRKHIDFGSFKRDVIVFKNMALFQTYFLVVRSIMNASAPGANFFTEFVNSFDAVAIVLLAFGYWIAIQSTVVLGIDRTYFGWELGYCRSEWISAFPYGVIPHPMILGQVLALLGLYRVAPFRAEWPLFVPIHCILYFVHMFQEHFSIYDTKNPVIIKEKKVN